MDLAEKELDRLDIVIENAGIATKEYRSTKDGWEETYLPPPIPSHPSSSSMYNEHH